MLAAASLGAVWSSCSPDFGEQGVLDRFGQIEPVALHRARRLFLRRQGDRRRRQDRRGGAQPAHRPQGPCRRLSWQGRRGRSRRREGAGAGGCAGALRAEARHLRAAAVFAPALHPVLVRHDRHSEMHRPFRRRHADPACQGTAAACRHRGWRPLFLFHHLRLDDVELAGVGAGLRRHPSALRRLALPPRRQCAVRFRAGREDDLFRHLGEIHRHRPQGRACSR